MPDMRHGRVLLVSIAAAMYLGAQQRPSRLAGRVEDPSRAAVPHAVVTIRKQADARFSLSAVTNDRGEYSLALPPGSYRVHVAAPGFEDWERQDVRLSTAAHRLDVALSMAVVPAHITVTAKTPVLEGEPELSPSNSREILEIREVRESSARDVGEALAKVEGVWKVRKGAIANDVILRGFQQDDISVLIDGARIHGACPNNMDPAAFHVDFAEIQQVEVTKGAFDITSQGSLGGAVRIVNKSPAAGLRITPSISAGSFGYVNTAVTTSLSAEQNYALGGYSYRRALPYDDGSGTSFTARANYRSFSQKPTAFDIGTAWMKAGVALPRRQRVTAGYTRQQGGQVLYPYLLMDAVYDNADRLNGTYVVDGFTGPLERIRAQAYYTRVRHWMTDELRVSSAGTPRNFSMGTFAATKALGGRVDADLHNLTLGFETYGRVWNVVNTMRMSGMHTDQAALPNARLAATGVYAQYRRAVGALLLHAGARLDSTFTQARGGTAGADLYWAYQNTRSRSRRDTQPSANVTATYALPGGLELFAGAGHTTRTPDPQERYFALRRNGADWVGNPDLRVTRNTESDAGIHFRHGRFTLRPTVFYSRLTDFVVVNNQPKRNAVPMLMNSAARSFANLDARMYGGELTYSVGLSRSLLWLGGLSYVRGIKDTLPRRRITDPDLAEIPPLKSRAALRYGSRIFFAEVEGIAARAQRRVDSDLRELATPGYAVINLKTGVHHRRVQAAIGLDNVTNRFYYEYCSFQRDPFRSGAKVPEPGRSAYVNLSVLF